MYGVQKDCFQVFVVRPTCRRKSTRGSNINGELACQNSRCMSQVPVVILSVLFPTIPPVQWNSWTLCAGPAGGRAHKHQFNEPKSSFNQNVGAQSRMRRRDNNGERTFGRTTLYSESIRKAKANFGAQAQTKNSLNTDPGRSQMQR